MNLPPDFVFSQSALQDYEDCPRRFELRYIKDLRWPALKTENALEFEASSIQGQEFHHLIHQHSLGVSAEAIEATITDPTMRKWWNNYVRWQAENLPKVRHSELKLTTPLSEHRVMAKYDLVAPQSDESLVIVDWKTGRPKKREWLARRLQTIVYPYVLWRAGDWLNGAEPISAEKIRLIYWFAEDSSTIEFQLNSELLQADEQRLMATISEVNSRFEFPKTENEKQCQFCVYRSLCERGIVAGKIEDLEEDDDVSVGINLHLDEVDEISF
jgi:CRISPR/Cas system-associated exonuclease Cas4 (RecB family)